MRTIKLIVVHCTATKEGRDVTVDELRKWHKQRGWADVGYHYIVYRDGTIAKGRPDSVMGAHVRGYNAHSIGVCYVGGLDYAGRPKDTRTDAQKAALIEILRELKSKYTQAKIVGHRDLSPDRDKDGRITPDEWLKACPCFEAAVEYSEL